MEKSPPKITKEGQPSDAKVRAAWVQTILREIPLSNLAHFLMELRKSGGIEECGCGGQGHHCATEVGGIPWESLLPEQVGRIRKDLNGIRMELKNQMKVHLDRVEKNM
ncbi:MAG: hypothetical protein MRK02_08575 [Candidatus Scalindua sp.]|nr:hypothetical protein [Candidatus Scalindua sp.]